MRIFQSPSPNYGPRHGCDVTCTVIHFTAGGKAAADISAALDPHNGKSWHYIIDRDGTTTQQVDLKMAAWHAGVSMHKHKGQARDNVNHYSIGIELANHGPIVQKADGTFYIALGDGLHRYVGPPPIKATLTYMGQAKALTSFWEPFPARQIKALRDLIASLPDMGYPAAAKDLVGHDEIARPVGRKDDPGPLLPFDFLGRDLVKYPRLVGSSIEHPADLLVV